MPTDEEQLTMMNEENSALRESCAEYDKLFTAIITAMVKELGADYVRCTVDECDKPQKSRSIKPDFW